MTPTSMAGLRPQHFLWEVQDRVATIRLDRPERKNPLTFDSYAELRDTFRALSSADDVDVVVLGSNGGNFCSGGDVHEIIGPLVAMDMKQLLAFTRMTGDLVKAMIGCGKPIIAAVDGVCVGAGAIIAMASDLRYGTVGVNLWPGVGFGLMNTPWGPYQGEGAQSGAGKVHNTAMLDNVEKTVLRGPFTTPYVPPWFVDHPRAAELGKRLTAFESEPSLKGLLSVHRSILKAGAAVPQLARARSRAR